MSQISTGQAGRTGIGLSVLDGEHKAEGRTRAEQVQNKGGPHAKEGVYSNVFELIGED